MADRFSHYMDHDPKDDTYSPDPEEPICSCGADDHFEGECPSTKQGRTEEETRAMLKQAAVSLEEFRVRMSQRQPVADILDEGPDVLSTDQRRNLAQQFASALLVEAGIAAMEKPRK